MRIGLNSDSFKGADAQIVWDPDTSNSRNEIECAAMQRSVPEHENCSSSGSARVGDVDGQGRDALEGCCGSFRRKLLEQLRCKDEEDGAVAEP